MKKIFTLFLALVASVGIIYASNTQVDGIWYDFNESNKTATVTYRGNNYFSYNNEYSGSVVIPPSVSYNGTTYSVTSIEYGAFMNCRSLSSITIPNSVTSIEGDAFGGCISLTSITINSDAIVNKSYDNSPNLSAIFGSQVTKYIIGDNVKGIGNYAFYECSSLTSITIPNSVTSIGYDAFRNCTKLKSVTIPNSVTSIGNDAFYNCTKLKSVTIGNSVTSIGNDAFYKCTGLTSVTIPNSVTSIKNGTFSSCSSLTSVTIGNSVTSIGADAFYKCISLTSITIPNSVTSIGWTAFQYCFSLTSVTIGNGVTSIEYGAFKDCESLTSVTIEAETPPTLDEKVFNNTKINTIYVPCNAVNAYKAAWSDYADRIRGNCTSSYTIKFKNWDGSVLQSKQVEEGKMPQYTGTTPTKPDDSQYTYTFSGWTPQIVAATADATYTATFTAELIPSFECTDVNDTWLQTGGSGLGEITTDNSGVWKYEYQYGACAKANSGETGWLLTPAKDLRGMKSVNLSFLHVHKNAGTFTDEMTLWVCANYKGSVSASQWKQLTISPYSANTNWTFISVSINVPLNMVGANTVFGFKYISSNSSAKWQIKELKLNAECATDEQGIEDVQSDEVQSTKVLRDGQVLILRNGKTYTMQGQEVK